MKFKDSSGIIDFTPSNYDFSGEFSMALSPDGSKLAYVGDYYGNTHIWVISTRTEAIALQLTDCASGQGQDRYSFMGGLGTVM